MLDDENTSYWNSRVEATGHTGWNSPCYKVDQLSRIFHVKQVIRRFLPVRDNDASFKFLDFGCGTGDFCELLESLGGSGIGVDISSSVIEVAERKARSATVFRKNLPDQKQRNVFDIILAVTVFQHFLDDNHLRETLAKLRELSSEQARFIVVEKVDVEADFANRAISNYLKSRSLEEWKALIDESGLKIEEVRHYPQNSVYFFDSLVELLNRRPGRKFSASTTVSVNETNSSARNNEPRLRASSSIIKSAMKTAFFSLLLSFGFIFDCVVRRNLFSKRKLRYYTFILSRN